MFHPVDLLVADPSCSLGSCSTLCSLSQAVYEEENIGEQYFCIFLFFSFKDSTGMTAIFLKNLQWHEKMQFMIKSQVNWIRVSFLFLYVEKEFTYLDSWGEAGTNGHSCFHFSHQPMSFFQFSVLTKNFLSSILWYSKIWFGLILILYFTAQLSECLLNTSFSMTYWSPGLLLIVSLHIVDAINEDGLLVEWSSSLMISFSPLPPTVCP